MEHRPEENESGSNALYFPCPHADVLAAFDSGKHRGPTRIDFHFAYDRKPMSQWNKIALSVFSQAFVEQYAAENYSISTVFDRIKEHFRGRRKAFRQIERHLSDAQLALQQQKARSSSRRISVSLPSYIQTTADLSFSCIGNE